MFPNKTPRNFSANFANNTNLSFDDFDVITRTLPLDMPSRIPSLRLAEGAAVRNRLRCCVRISNEPSKLPRALANCHLLPFAIC